METTINVNGTPVVVANDSSTLLQVLRDQVGIVSTKAGCSPQGQCGCCTVLIDGEPRISCVTPVRRVNGRSVTTLEGLDPATADRWANALCATGASQCGYCTPGIIMRLEGARCAEKLNEPDAVAHQLAAHLCRCSGWQTIVESVVMVTSGTDIVDRRAQLDDAERRASIEGRAPQRVGPHIALGQGGFSADTAPPDALVAILDSTGNWVVAESIGAARKLAGRVQGRNSTVTYPPPLSIPEGDWDLALATSWVDVGYLETDSVWATPQGEMSELLANGGAFGSKSTTELADAATRLAQQHQRPVLARWLREDVIARSPKRPPLAFGLRGDGTGHVVVAAAHDIAELIHQAAPQVTIETVPLTGPPVSAAIRGAGWAELAAAVGVLGAEPDQPIEVRHPGGGLALADYDGSTISVSVNAGRALDEVTLRSYCIGAAHMACSWVTSESLAVDADGTVHDLTIRSLGILKAAHTPRIDIVIENSNEEPVNASDAVFAAVAGAVWRFHGLPRSWPTRLGSST